MPNKIHYFWAGNNISEKTLMNIIDMKSENPGFSINLWVSNKSLINETFNSILNRCNCGIVFGYEFYKLKIGEDNSKHKEKKENNFFIRDIAEAFKLLRGFSFLESMFYRNIHGYYHNYALASDIARLVILYAEGGIYLDVDVKLKVKHSNVINEAQFKNVNAQDGIAFGNVTGDAWKGNSFGGNAILAAPFKSNIVFKILNIINDKIKDNLSIKYADISEISSKPKNNNPFHINNPINPNKQISLMSLGDFGSAHKKDEFNIWQNAKERCPDGAKDTWSASRVVPDFRYEAACYTTGPKMHEEYLKTIDYRRGYKESNKPSQQFRFEKSGEQLFEKVDAHGEWRNTSKIKKTKGTRTNFTSDETEFPSLSDFILGDIEIRRLLEKLNWI